MGSATDDYAIEGKTVRGFEKSYALRPYMADRDTTYCFPLQRKYKTVQKLEGATTQKSLDEEVKSTENIPIESTSQKPKSADEDSAQTKQDTQTSSNLTLAKKDSKQYGGVEEAKEKLTYATGTSTNTAQSEQGVNAQEKDTVDSVEAAAVTPKEPEDVTPNDKMNGT